MALLGQLNQGATSAASLQWERSQRQPSPQFELELRGRTEAGKWVWLTTRAGGPQQEQYQSPQRKQTRLDMWAMGGVRRKRLIDPHGTSC